MAANKVEAFKEEIDSPKLIGRRIYILRLCYGFEESLSGFARSCGISLQALSNYERGEKRPEYEQLNLIRRYTKATFDYVLYGVEDGLPFFLREKVAEIEAGLKKTGPRPSSRHRSV